jgi:TetR/AcrR family transcriptional regulator, mexJK operon transcriptional repressor
LILALRLTAVLLARLRRRVEQAAAGDMPSGDLSGQRHRLAAEQFLALLTGPMEHRSGLGTRAVPAAESAAIADAAVGTFLIACRPSAPGG